jgi:hypothetical protein
MALLHARCASEAHKGVLQLHTSQPSMACPQCLRAPLRPAGAPGSPKPVGQQGNGP